MKAPVAANDAMKVRRSIFHLQKGEKSKVRISDIFQIPFYSKEIVLKYIYHWKSLSPRRSGNPAALREMAQRRLEAQARNLWRLRLNSTHGVLEELAGELRNVRRDLT
jgi:hypothetical protein